MKVYAFLLPPEYAEERPDQYIGEEYCVRIREVLEGITNWIIKRMNRSSVSKSEPTQRYYYVTGHSANDKHACQVRKGLGRLSSKYLVNTINLGSQDDDGFVQQFDHTERGLVYFPETAPHKQTIQWRLYLSLTLFYIKLFVLGPKVERIHTQISRFCSKRSILKGSRKIDRHNSRTPSSTLINAFLQWLDAAFALHVPKKDSDPKEDANIKLRATQDEHEMRKELES